MFIHSKELFCHRSLYLRKNMHVLQTHNPKNTVGRQLPLLMFSSSCPNKLFKRTWLRTFHHSCDSACFYMLSSCSSLDSFMLANMFSNHQWARLSIIVVISTWIPNSALNILHVPKRSQGMPWNTARNICVIYFNNKFTLCLHNQGYNYYMNPSALLVSRHVWTV